MAAAVARKKALNLGLPIEADSAGTHSYHVGECADRRACLVAERRGYSLQAHRARQVVDQDFFRSNYILVMDRHNMSSLQSFWPPESESVQPQFLADFARSLPSREISDPYYGGVQAFELALDLIEISIDTWYQELQRES